jgi:hypothetical protein
MPTKRLQKIAAMAAGGVLLIWVYLGMVTFAIKREHSVLVRDLADAEKKVSELTVALRDFREFSSRAAAEAPRFAWAQELENSLARPFMVEVPLRLNAAFKKGGFANAEVHLAQMLPFSALADFALAKWELHVPSGRVLSFGELLASLENDFPLGHLNSLQVRRLDPTGSCDIALEFEMLVRP